MLGSMEAIPRPMPFKVIANIAKKVIALTPYRVTRGAGNRFQEIPHCLATLKRLGFAPTRIIDCGAHLGAFSLDAHALFPGVKVDMIEPQPACRPTLERFAAAHGFVFHAFALDDAVGEVQMLCSRELNTGAHVASAKVKLQQDEVLETVRATTLDALFPSQGDSDDRLLLKLDLQGHELKALKGGVDILRRTDVVIVEVSFFQYADVPTIPEMVAFFDANGFDLFDVAALAGRTRDDRLRQGDLVFAQRGSRFLADTRWA